MSNTSAEEFSRFIARIPADVMPNVWFIPLRKGTKEPDIPQGESLKDAKHRLTPAQAADRIISGRNVGIYAMKGGLLFIDADTDKGNIILPEEIRKTIPETLTIKTRNAGLQYYYLNDGIFKNKIHTYNGGKAGEIRADWQYVVTPGSYVRPDDNAGKDAEGLYRIIKDEQISQLIQLPEGIKVKEDKPKKELEIKTLHTWKNDFGMLLFEIRKKDSKLDELLKGAYDCGHPSRSEADMAAAQKLYFWRFNNSEIAGILREYRPYEKTAHDDYIETTINNIIPGEQYTKNYRKKKAQKQIGLDGSEIKDAIERGLIAAWKNNFELAEEFQKATPVYYDISKNFWIWNSNEKYYFRCDETDILSNIHKKSGEEVWESTKKREIVECIKITGRRREVKECCKTWIHTLSGIVDYVTGETIAATPDYFLTSPIPHKIGSSDNIPTINKLFTDWLGDRKQVLYEWIAYNLIDDYPMHRMLILFGRGRNGKSQYTELLSRFIGRKNTTATDLEKVIDSRFEASKLYRKKSALIGETNFTAIKSSARIKALTGADMLTAEYKNKDPFDFTNSAKITISTNNLPESLDKTDAFFARCLIEEFTKQFEDGKSIIETIPEEEYENLLFKCIKLLPSLMEKGKFTNEGTIEQKAAKYERLSNPFPVFIEKELDEAPTDKYTPVWVLREMYHSFCVKNGFRAVGEREFTQMLNKDYETKKRRYGEKGEKYWNTVYGLVPKIPYVNVEPAPLEPLEPDVSTYSPYVRKQVELCGSSGSSGAENKNYSQILNAIYRKITTEYTNGNRPSPAGWDLELRQIMEDHDIPMSVAAQYLKDVRAQLGW